MAVVGIHAETLANIANAIRKRTGLTKGITPANMDDMIDELLARADAVTGPPGASAYDLAVEQGFTGTLEEWLLSLVGPPGAQGPQGIQGERGDDGLQGATGPQGEQGPEGPQGPQGPKGDKGIAGGQGVTFRPSVSAEGVISWTNNGGAANPEPINIRGPQGIQGERGPQGADGTVSFDNLTEGQRASLKGEKGDKGDTGLQGPQGFKGDTGETGPQGIQGERGPQGETGPEGVGIASITLGSDYTLTITMSDGTVYTTGSIRGLQGERGPQGIQGERGPQGETGPQGEPGIGGLEVDTNGDLMPVE